MKFREVKKVVIEKSRNDSKAKTISVKTYGPYGNLLTSKYYFVFDEEYANNYQEELRKYVTLGFSSMGMDFSHYVRGVNLTINDYKGVKVTF